MGQVDRMGCHGWDGAADLLGDAAVRFEEMGGERVEVTSLSLTPAPRSLPRNTCVASSQLIRKDQGGGNYPPK